MTAAEAGSVPSHSPQNLRRTLGFWALVMYGLAYIAPVAPLMTLGFVWDASHHLIALAYLFGGLCMYFTGKSYAMMACEVTSAGSVYGFARHVLGPFAGFMAGWMILLDYLLIPAYVYVSMAIAMEQIFPNVSRMVWILLMVGGTTAINWFGVGLTSKVSTLTVVIQVGMVVALCVFAVIALMHGHGSGTLGAGPLFDPRRFSALAIFHGTSICVMSYLGFDAISTLAEDTKDPSGRTLGRAIIFVLLFATALFALTAWILGNLMAGTPISDPASAIYQMASETIGAWAALSMAWVIAIVVGFTNALPMQVGVARVLFAMGRDRQLFAVFAKLHAKHNTPWVAMLVSTGISVAVAIALRNQVDELASIVNFGALMGFLMLHVSVVVHLGVRDRSRRWFQHWVAPMLGIVVVLAVLSGMSALAVKIGVSWLVAGVAYALFLRWRGVEAELTV